MRHPQQRVALALVVLVALERKPAPARGIFERPHVAARDAKMKNYHHRRRRHRYRQRRRHRCRRRRRQNHPSVREGCLRVFWGKPLRDGGGWENPKVTLLQLLVYFLLAQRHFTQQTPSGV